MASSGFGKTAGAVASQAAGLAPPARATAPQPTELTELSKSLAASWKDAAPPEPKLGNPDDLSTTPQAADFEKYFAVRDAAVQEHFAPLITAIGGDPSKFDFSKFNPEAFASIVSQPGGDSNPAKALQLSTLDWVNSGIQDFEAYTRAAGMAIRDNWTPEQMMKEYNESSYKPSAFSKFMASGIKAGLATMVGAGLGDAAGLWDLGAGANAATSASGAFTGEAAVGAGAGSGTGLTTAGTTAAGTTQGLVPLTPGTVGTSTVANVTAGADAAGKIALASGAGKGALTMAEMMQATGLTAAEITAAGGVSSGSVVGAGTAAAATTGKTVLDKVTGKVVAAGTKVIDKVLDDPIGAGLGLAAVAGGGGGGGGSNVPDLITGAFNAPTVADTTWKQWQDQQGKYDADVAAIDTMGKKYALDADRIAGKYESLGDQWDNEDSPWLNARRDALLGDASRSRDEMASAAASGDAAINEFFRPAYNKFSTYTDKLNDEGYIGQQVGRAMEESDALSEASDGQLRRRYASMGVGSGAALAGFQEDAFRRSQAKMNAATGTRDSLFKQYGTALGTLGELGAKGGDLGVRSAQNKVNASKYGFDVMKGASDFGADVAGMGLKAGDLKAKGFAGALDAKKESIGFQGAGLNAGVGLQKARTDTASVVGSLYNNYIQANNGTLNAANNSANLDYTKDKDFGASLKWLWEQYNKP